MLNAAQRAKCAKLAQALDEGDRATYRRAEPSLTPEMRGEVWDQRAHVKAMAARGHKTLPPTDGKVSAAVMHDLDYWGDAEPDEQSDDPDDEMDLKTKVCDNCRGLGLTSDGVRCTRCNGSGRVDRDDVDDGDDDDDDREKETDE
jgi:hypothetical protein